MIACQIKVDGEWSTGCYLKDPARLSVLEEGWRRYLGPLGLRAFRAIPATEGGPSWRVDIRNEQGDWLLGSEIYVADLKAFTVLVEAMAKLLGLEPSDWRIVPHKRVMP